MTAVRRNAFVPIKRNKRTRCATSETAKKSNGGGEEATRRNRLGASTKAAFHVAFSNRRLDTASKSSPSYTTASSSNGADASTKAVFTTPNAVDPSARNAENTDRAASRPPPLARPAEHDATAAPPTAISVTSPSPLGARRPNAATIGSNLGNDHRRVADVVFASVSKTLDDVDAYPPFASILVTDVTDRKSVV